MDLPAPLAEHKLPLWCVMFKNQVVNRQPTNTFIWATVLTSANRQPAKEVRQVKLLPWLRFKPEVMELYATQRTAATRHVTLRVCVDLEDCVQSMRLTFCGLS